MRWKANNLNKPKVFDSKDLSEDTQKIRLDKIQEKLKEEKDYQEEFRAYEEYKILEKRKRKKILISITIILLLLIVLVSFLSVKKFSEITMLEYKAQEYMEKEEYNKAAQIYKKLYEETEEKEYLQNYKFVSKDIEDKELLKEAEENIKEKEYESAVEVLLSISTNNDKFAEEINKKINVVADAWFEEIEGYYKQGKLDKSFTEINKLVNLLPDNIKAIDLKNKILKANQVNEEAQGKKDIERLSTKLSKKMYEKSKRIVGTEQYITVENAGVRVSPSREANLSGKVKKGNKVYIEDTYVEGANSIWCKISYYEDGTYKTGWVSHSIISGT